MTSPVITFAVRPTRRRWVRAGVLVTALLAAAAAAVLLAAPAWAHPLGNFSVNQYAGLRVHPDRVVVDYVLDMAEIPAFQTEGQEMDADRDGSVSRAERDRWREQTCAATAARLRLSRDGRPVTLAVARSDLAFPPGAGGLRTLRLSCLLTAPVRIERSTRLALGADAYPERVGWREITARGDGVTLARSSVPADGTSARLTRYPEDLLSAPLDVREAELEVRPGGPRLGLSGDLEQAGADDAADPGGPLARGADRLSEAFTELASRRQLTVAFGLLAVLASVLLGGAHALAPGHGKTVMAAYLVGGRGSLRQALTIGLTVTATHTVGVLVLGVVLATTAAIAPQRLYPLLGVASGLLLAGVGALLLRRAARPGAWPPHDHHHPHGRHHSHGHTHGHGPGHDHGHDHPHPHPHRHAHPHPHPHVDADADDLEDSPAPARALVHAGAGGQDRPHDRVSALALVRAGGGDRHDHADDHDHAHSHNGGHSHDHDHAHSHNGGHSHDHDHAHDGEHAHDRAQAHDGDHAHTATSARLRAAHDGGHSHDHDHAHDLAHASGSARLRAAADVHHHAHGDAVGDAAAWSDRRARRRGLLAIGFAGGLVPSPSALVVLLGAVALGRTWFGVLLVLGYGIGMAAALVGVGLLLARGRRLLERHARRPQLCWAMSRLPVVTAALIVVVGLGLTAQAAASLLGA